MAQYNITIDSEILHYLFVKETKDEKLAKLLDSVLNQILAAQVTKQVKVEPYERTEERQHYRNGYYSRSLITRVGTLTLRVPRLRNGKFTTDLFNRYQRSEQALLLALMEMVVNGVSTRKIEEITYGTLWNLNLEIHNFRALQKSRSYYYSVEFKTFKRKKLSLCYS